MQYCQCFYNFALKVQPKKPISAPLTSRTCESLNIGFMTATEVNGGCGIDKYCFRNFSETSKIPKKSISNLKSSRFSHHNGCVFLFSGLCVIKKSDLFIVVKNKIQSPKKVILSEFLQNSKFASNNGNIWNVYQNITVFFSDPKNFKKSSSKYSSYSENFGFANSIAQIINCWPWWWIWWQVWNRNHLKSDNYKMFNLIEKSKYRSTLSKE